MVKWPFQRLSDLQLGDHKVTLNRLVYNFSSPPFKKDLPNTNHEQKPSFPLYWLLKNGILLMAYYNPQITWIVCCIIPYIYPINNKFLSWLTLLPGRHPNRLMEPKYLSFRRWLRTQSSSDKVIGSLRLALITSKKKPFWNPSAVRPIAAFFITVAY